MWKSFGQAINIAKSQATLLTVENLVQNQIRTTFVLKRKFPAPLHKKGQKPRTLRSKHYVYELLQQTHVERQPDIDVILTANIEGIGSLGDKVSVKSSFAYNNLLLPGLAVYSNTENLEKYKNYVFKEQERPSSPYALLTVKIMARMVLSVVMNLETPWILKPWHIRVSFRKCGYIVAEDAISLPEKPIEGPNMSLENKEFFVTVTINNREKVNVKCRIHHWSTDVTNRIPYQPYFWEEPTQAIFSEQVDILNTLPKKPITRNLETKLH